MRRVFLLLAGLLSLASIAVASSGGTTQAQPRWVITDLGTLGGTESDAMAISERGQIVGWAEMKTKATDGDPIYHAFLWQKGRMRDLGAPRLFPRSMATAVNDHGQVVLIAQAYSKEWRTPARAYIWETGRLRDLGTPRGNSGVAVAINERGQIVGCLEDWGGTGPVACVDGRSFLWEKGKITYLQTKAGLDVRATAINDRGQVVGQSVGSPGRAFLWTTGTLHDLGTLGGKVSSANAIAASGWIVGWAESEKINRADDYDDHGSPMRRPFIWAGGKMRDLGTFGGPDGDATAINRRGQIAGWADTAKTSAADNAHMGSTCGDFKYSHPAPHAFLWANGRLLDLGTLGGLESEATAVNDKGQVVGWADTKRKDSDGCRVSHAFVWQKGWMTDLGTLSGGTESYARAINNQGHIIGWSKANDGSYHAVMWRLTR